MSRNRRKHHASPMVAPLKEPGLKSAFAQGPQAWGQFQAFMQANPDTAPRRPFKAPELPPGVVPPGVTMACDSPSLNAYSWLNAQPGLCGLGFPGYTYLSELFQRSEYRAPTETIAGEMTREWINFTGADEKKLKELREAFEKFKVRDCFRAMSAYDGAFGRGQLYVRIKGQLTDAGRARPLIVDDDNAGKTVPKDSLLGFKPIEPIWTTPYVYNSNDPTEDNFYKPDRWYVLGKETHASRLLTFVGRPVPDILKPSYNFSGMSLSQLVEPYVVRWLKTVDSVNRLISRFSLTALKTNMMATLQGGQHAELFKRAEFFNKVADNRGLMLLDMMAEDLVQLNTPLSGLSDLQAQAQEHMAAPTHIPLVKLTGITPSGLNASSEEDLKVFYDFIGSEQINLFQDHLITVSKIVQCHLWGAVDPDIKHEWVPLDSPSDKEESEMRKADGDRDTAYVTNAVLSPEEVRERLRMDPKSGYSFIKAEDAPATPLEAEAEIGAENAEAEHERGQETSATEHERATETAEADHKRAIELERIKAAAKLKAKA